MNKTYFLTVVGDGLAAHFFIHHFITKGLELNVDFSKMQIAVIRHPEFRPSSDKSLGLLALRGAKVNNPYGNQIYQGFQMMKEWIDHSRPEWAQLSKFYSLCNNKDSKKMEDFSRRFPKDVRNFNQHYKIHEELGYLIETKDLLNDLRAKYQQYYDVINDLIILPNLMAPFCENLQTLKSKNYQTKNVVLCTGHYSKLALGEMKQNLLSSQGILGQYLIWKNVDFMESFCFDYEDFILSYNKNSKQLSLGFSNSHSLFLDNTSHVGPLAKAYHLFSNLLKKTIIIPPMDQAIMQQGVRLKNPKRIVLGQQWVKNGPYALIGLYKNSLSAGFMMSQHLANTIWDHLKNQLRP